MPSGAVQRRLPASLREHRTFRLLFWGQALSVVGDRITPVAIAFAVLGLGSASDLGLVLAAGGIPFALFAPGGRRVGRPRRPAPGHARLRHRPRALAERHRRAAAHGHRGGVDARGARLRLRHRRGRLHARADRADPADREPCPPAGGQRPARADAQHRERGRPGAGRRARRLGRLGRGDRRRRGDLRGQRPVPGADARGDRADGGRDARRCLRGARALPGGPARADGTRCARARG